MARKKKTRARRTHGGAKALSTKRRKPQAAARRAPKSRGAARPASLRSASHQTRMAVFRGIDDMLREHGIAQRVAALHLEPAESKECPPGTVLRQVCWRDEDGQLVCEERCVPI